MAIIERTLRGQIAGVPGWSLASLRLLRGVIYGLALVALALVVQMALTHGQRLFDDVRYGYPRRASIVGYVGHGDERYSPTFIETLNMNGQISTLVVPGGDIEQLQVLEGPYVVGSDGSYIVAQPALQDMNDDGHVDLIVTVRDEAIVYMNEDGSFRIMTMEERAELAGEWNED